MSKKKYPDLVVWDESKGWYARTLDYGSNLSAPAIRAEDVSGWKQSNVNQVNSHFKTEYEELIGKAEALKEEFLWNHFIYTKIAYAFVPIVGHVYHVYEKEDGTFFMSLIEPQSWKQKYIASTKLDSSNKWIKINNLNVT